MTEVKLTAEDLQDDGETVGREELLAHADEISRTTAFGWAAGILRKIAEQLPKPVPEEPTGDVLVDVGGELLRPRPPHWMPCVGYTNNPPTWAELVDDLDGQIKIYDRRVATPPTEEVAELAMTEDEIDASQAAANAKLWEGAERLDLVPAPAAEADPLETLVQRLVGALWSGVDNDQEVWAREIREFAERVRALATEDTVPADKVRDLTGRWRSEEVSKAPAVDRWEIGARVAMGRAASELEALLPKAGQ